MKRMDEMGHPFLKTRAWPRNDFQRNFHSNWRYRNVHVFHVNSCLAFIQLFVTWRNRNF